MSIFSDNSIVCICCRERMQIHNISVFYDNIGICKNCFEKFDRIPPGSPFDGIGDVSCIFPAFYYNDILKNLIYRYKFNCEWKIGKLLSKLIYENLKDVNYIHEFDFITPIPLSRQRIFQRGFNQSEIIAKEISALLDIPFTLCVYRHRNTVAQSLLKRHDRIHNITNAFIADKDKVFGKDIIIFDDIFTTGATINSCAKELKQKGAKTIIGISLAATKPYIK